MYKSVDDFNFEGKKVLIRVDFNVPLTEEGKISDDRRITMALPTIRRVIETGGTPIIMSHLGRPKGNVVDSMSLKPISNYLNENGFTCHFAEDCVGEIAERTVSKANPGEIVLLENLRFHKEETDNDSGFAKQLARLGDVYVNDAFGTAHRAHASTEAVVLLFENRLCGYLIQKELKFLGEALENSQSPFTAIIGGAKISGKIDVINQFFGKCDNIIIGGGMAFTFYKAMGYEIGSSLLEEDKIDLAKQLIEKSKDSSTKILLPLDIACAKEFNNDSETGVFDSDKIPSDMMGLDIGPKSVEQFSDIIKASKTIVWNGPMGVFEMSNFAKGTFSIANALAEATENGAISIVGGGDSASAIKKSNLLDKISHVSTGGGASLEFLEGKELPGIKALEN